MSDDTRAQEIAQSMLARYSTPRKAFEMACLHEHDSREPAHWRAVQLAIRQIAGLGADGNPRK